MNTLNRSTLRRLEQLKQVPAVWEGDRRTLPKTRERQEGTNLVHIGSLDTTDQPQCILWVDASMGMVRSMDVVEPSVGQEAFVRALLQAFERPQSPAQPGLPQKILVRDRELQFYLRGILKDLDITVEHVDQLPLIDEIFANIIEHTNSSPPAVPSAQAPALYYQADLLWRNTPWDYLWDHEVLAIELNQWDIDTLYAVVMGRMGLEQGVIFYRSKESLLQFRHRIATEESEERLEETFLHQDCLFALFESAESLSEAEIRVIRSHGWPVNHENTYPIFGMLHPLEGGRPFLYEEEAIASIVAMESLNKFLSQHAAKLRLGKFSVLQGHYDIQVPAASNSGTIQVTVKTLPELAEEIYSLTEDEEDDFDDESEPLICEDLWPDNALFQLLGIPWSYIAAVRKTASTCYLAAKSFPEKGDELSGLLIQTSRPKALDLIEEIEDFGGIKAICFNPAESFLGESCELGLIVMGNDDLHLFGEFPQDDVAQEEIRKKWLQRCKTAKGNCAVIIAMGITGASRGKPEPHHVLGYYEVKLMSAKELGLGKLRSEPLFELDF